jgi:polyferredoxin
MSFFKKIKSPNISSKNWSTARKVSQILFFIFFCLWIFLTRDSGGDNTTLSEMINIFSPIHDSSRIAELKDESGKFSKKLDIEEFINPENPLILLSDGHYYSSGPDTEFFIPNRDGDPIQVDTHHAVALNLTDYNPIKLSKNKISIEAFKDKPVIILRDNLNLYYYTESQRNPNNLVPIYFLGVGSGIKIQFRNLPLFEEWKINDRDLLDDGFIRGAFLSGNLLYTKAENLHPVIRKIRKKNGDKGYLVLKKTVYRGERNLSFLQFSPLSGLITGFTLKEWIKDYGLAILILFLSIPLGRFFCGWICPLGTAIDTFDKFFAKKNRLLSIKNTKHPRYIKYIILVSLICSGIIGLNLVGWFDPLSNIMRGLGLAIYSFGDGILKLVNDHIFNEPGISFVIGETSLFEFNNPVPSLRMLPGSTRWYHFLGTPFILFIFLSIIFLGLFHKRFWCQYLCPLGALYGIISYLPGLKRIVDLKRCTNCLSCETSCRMNAIYHYGEANIKGECIQCMDCLKDCRDKAIQFEFSWFKNRHTSKDFSSILNLRQFAGGILLGIFSFLLLKTGRNFETRKARQIIRPPGARTSITGEDDFTKACIRCGECMKVCVNNALHPVPLGEGDLSTLWTPMVVPRLGCCEFKCTLCGEVCPTDAIKPFTFTEYADGSIDDRKWYIEELEINANINKDAYSSIFYIKNTDKLIYYGHVFNTLNFYKSESKVIGIFALSKKFMNIIRTIDNFGFRGKYIVFGDPKRILIERRMIKKDRLLYNKLTNRLSYVEFARLDRLERQNPASSHMIMTLKEVNEINQVSFSNHQIDILVSSSKKERRFIGTAVFDKNRCYPYLDHNPTPCTVCEEVCPVSDEIRGGKAIQVVKRKVYNHAEQKWIEVQQPYIVQDLCVGCGICEQECPSGKTEGFMTSRAAIYVAPPNYDFKGDDWDKKVRKFKPGEKENIKKKLNLKDNTY